MSFTELLALLLPFAKLIAIPCVVAIVIGGQLYLMFIDKFASLFMKLSVAIFYILIFFLFVIVSLNESFPSSNNWAPVPLMLGVFIFQGFMTTRAGKLIEEMWDNNNLQTVEGDTSSVRQPNRPKVFNYAVASIIMILMFMLYGSLRAENVEKNYHFVKFKYEGSEYESSDNFHYIGRTEKYVFCSVDFDDYSVTQIFPADELESFSIRRNEAFGKYNPYEGMYEDE